MSRKRLSPKDRIKSRSGTANWQAYLGDYRDVGGGRWESLRTADWDEAYANLIARLDELNEARKNPDTESDPLLVDFAARHFRTKLVKVDKGTSSLGTITESKRHINRVIAYFEDMGLPEARLSDLDGNDAWVTDFVLWLSGQPGVHEGTTLSAQTIRNIVFSLSGLLKRAQREGLIERNPVNGHADIPERETTEAVWLEPGEVWRFLRVCADQPPILDELGRNFWNRSTKNLFEIFATFAYTGGREEEVLGLEVGDLDFRNRYVWFRPNAVRPKLKRPWHRRRVPMWPDLHQILSAYMKRDDAPASGLLFRSKKRGEMIRDLRRPIDTVLEKAEIHKDVTLHTFRHSYAAFRLQTLDNEQPVAPFTVMRELGHGSWNVFRKHYAHLLDSRPRYKEVAYREPQVLDLEEGRKRLASKT